MRLDCELASTRCLVNTALRLLEAKGRQDPSQNGEGRLKGFFAHELKWWQEVVALRFPAACSTGASSMHTALFQA